MKILIVIPYFMPAISYGGPVRVAYDIARAMVSRGHEVTVATTDVFDEKRRVEQTEELLEGIQIKRFRNLSNALAKQVNGYLPPLFIPWIFRNAKKYDVIYSHDFFSLQTLSAGFVSRYHNVPLVIQPHGSLSEVRREARFSSAKNMLIALFSGVLRGAKNIIALTQEEKKSIGNILKGDDSQVVVIPNGLEPASYLDIKPVHLHERYNIPEGNKIVGFIGRLAYIKGLDISLKVLASLKDKHAFTFLIIGPDEGEMAGLKKLADALGLGGRVIFAGILDGDEKLQVIKSCDFFLFTSRDEGLPMTVLEVAALGIPQILSSECHVPEVATYQAGFVHPCHDIPALARSVDTLLGEQIDRTQLSRNAQLMVRERFSTNQVMDRIEEVLK